MYRPLWTPPYPRAVVFKWLLMDFLAGNVNAGGFMACKRFVTHVTGFGTLFGIAVADGDAWGAVGMLSVPAFFVLGAMIGAFFTDAAIARGRAPQFHLAMGTASLLLAAAAWCGYRHAFGNFGSIFILERDYALVALLCCASGIVNAVATTSSGGAVRGTHLTGLTTDVAVGLVRGLFGHRTANLKAKQRARNRLRSAAIASFALGSVVGALLFRQAEFLGFLLPCVLALYCGNLGSRAALAAAAAKTAAAG